MREVFLFNGEDIINGDSFIMLSCEGILRWWNMDSVYSLFWFRWRQTLDPFDLSCVKSRAPKWGLTIRHSGTWAHSGNNVRHATSPGVSLKKIQKKKNTLEFSVNELPGVPTSFGQDFSKKSLNVKNGGKFAEVCLYSSLAVEISPQFDEFSFCKKYKLKCLHITWSGTSREGKM